MVGDTDCVLCGSVGALKSPLGIQIAGYGLLAKQVIESISEALGEKKSK